MKCRKINYADAQEILNFYVENRTHLTPWEPERNEHFYTLEYWR